MAAGELYLSGRAKDLIIRGGRNIYPYDVETAVGNLQGLRKGCVAVFGSGDAAGGSERLVVLAETCEQDADARRGLRQAINRVALDLTGVPPDDIVLAPPHSVLKTSPAARSAAPPAASCTSAARWVPRRAVAPAAAPVGVVRPGRAPGAAFCRPVLRRLLWALLLGFASLTWLAVALLPKRSWCRRLVRRSARLFLHLVGVPLQVSGLGQLRLPEVRVLVANHASYLDGLVLCAVLPPGFAFVAKRELAGQFIAGRFLRRLGTCFVERFDPQRSAADAEALGAALESGQSLVFFPEGTLSREPGLQAFRMGAFVLAARADVPLLPVALGARAHGAARRSVVPPSRRRTGGTLWPVAGRRAREWLDATAAHKARAPLLRRLDEPDRLRLAG
nr:lysophospholipid acyltransferase family protein [Pseudomonas lalucatii]